MTRYDTFSLTGLIEDLCDSFAGVTEVYLFGSRRHRTRSLRSDVDLLIVGNAEVMPEDLRDFAMDRCSALDLFLLDDQTATSCANGSKVRARSKRDLVSKLGALKLWDRSTGFVDTDGNVDWQFHVIKGLDPVITTLVTGVPYPAKAENVGPEDTVPASSESGWAAVAKHPVVILAVTAVAVAGATFAVINQTRIVPLEREIESIRDAAQPPSASSLNTSPSLVAEPDPTDMISAVGADTTRQQ